MNFKNCTVRLAQCFKILLVATVAGSLVQSAHATLLFSEGFNYSTGGLGSLVLRRGQAETMASSITNANLTYSGLQDLGGNALLLTNGSGGSSVATYANQTAGQVYYSFLFDPLAVDSGNNYFTALNPSHHCPAAARTLINAYYYSTRQRLNCDPAAAGRHAAGTGSTLTIGTTYLIVEELRPHRKRLRAFGLIRPWRGSRSYSHCNHFRYHRDGSGQCGIKNDKRHGCLRN